MDKLQKYRQQIDEIDAKIIRLIARRFEVVKKISRLKQNRNLPMLDSERWRVLLGSRIKQAKTLKLNPHLIKKIYDEIHKFILNTKD